MRSRTPLPREAPWSGRRRAAAAGRVLVLSSLLAALGGGVAGWVPAVAADPPQASPAERPADPAVAVAEATRLPTGARLDPAGRSTDLGNMPIAALPAPEGNRVVVLLAGWREQGIQVVETATGRVVQTFDLPAAFLGLAFSRDGRTLYVAGGNADAIYRFAWDGGAESPASPAGSIPLAARSEGQLGSRFPAGLALSPDGARLYVAENLADSLAVVDLASGSVVQRLPAGHYPYGVAATPEGEVYVSAWGGDVVTAFAPTPAAAPASGPLRQSGRIRVGHHPSALLLAAAAHRLFVASASTDRVAVIDTPTRRVLAELRDPPPGGAAEGSTPSALALAAGGRRLLVAESDNNAVAVFDLGARTSGVAGSPAPAGSGSRTRDRLAGRIPVGWYPTAVATAGDSLVAINGKGRGAGPNPTGPQPGVAQADPHAYTLGQTNGTFTVLAGVPPAAELAELSRRVAQANGWDAQVKRAAAAPARQRRGARRLGYPPFRHVVYIIKENRTYDQVFADLPGGDGDPRLQFFTAREAPNHRALAERFGLFDHFLTNGEVSTQGHEWSTAAYATDYTEKTTPSGYSNRRGGDDDDGSEPAAGYLWDLARSRGVAVRNYGEFAKAFKQADGAVEYRATIRSAARCTSPTYPAWDLAIKDQKRADAWIAELHAFVARGSMPALEILHLPNDHTSGARPGMPTPRAYMADNDLALGRIVEALSHSPFWHDTVVFVLEDDAQNGPDHVDSHRAPLLVISPYSRAGAVHRFANTTDVLATIEEILGLGAMSQFDTFGRPLRGIFAAAPDLAPYDALTPEQPLTDLNPGEGAGARQSSAFDWSAPDAAPAAELNLILWRNLKGQAAYPAPARVSTLEVQRAN